MADRRSPDVHSSDSDLRAEPEMTEDSDEAGEEVCALDSARVQPARAPNLRYVETSLDDLSWSSEERAPGNRGGESVSN